MARTGGQLAETGGVGNVAVVELYIVICWVWQSLLGLVWRVSMAVGALCVLACRLGLVARLCGLWFAYFLLVCRPRRAP